MPAIIALSGSLRRGSYNTALLRAAASMVPEDVTFEIASLAGIPLYNGDDEAERGLPPEAAALKEKIASADGVLLATPEYNFGITPVLKNAIDWSSRPSKDIPRVFGKRCVGTIGASNGPGGTRMAQAAWLPTLHRLGMRVFSERSLYVANGGTVFDADGAMIDEKVKDALAKYVQAFAAFIRQR